MVNKEKELCGQENREIEGEKEIVEMDRAIEEKEEILNKLMDSVKGYSAMKCDFEKLLGAIGALEMERRELETELDRAKRAADAQIQAGGVAAATAGGAAVERIKERFLKVKEELKIMREERKNKENAYRLMQRESKQCEALQRDLRKLRESKVSVIKQQKSQAAHFQKLRKEQLQKVSTLKKSDVKKQRQVNTLKSELVKKERVLGHKDREIGRINSKLKACEDHISQLLRIQNRNRARLTSNIGGLGKACSSEQCKNAMSAADLEHLISSKAMLDNLVYDRVEKRRVKALYERKSQSLRELNREMIQEACEMEALLARRKALGGSDLDEEDEDPFAAAANLDLEEERVGTEDLSFVMATPAPLSDEEVDRRAELAEVRLCLRQCEANIDRLSRELDLYNADLDDLAERMAIDNKKAPNVAGAIESTVVGKDAWEDLCREVVAGFALTQFQPLVWDLVGEKADALEDSRRMQDELDEARESGETLAEKLVEAEKALAHIRADMKNRLDKAERQRVQDVWAVIKASQGTSTSSSGDSAISNNELSAVGTRAAVQRAQDLERELESFIASDEAMRLKVSEQALAVTVLESQLAASNLRCKLLCPSDAAAVDSSVASACFDRLHIMWERLGLCEDAREEVVGDLREVFHFIYLILLFLSSLIKFTSPFLGKQKGARCCVICGRQVATTSGT